jgi:hypothetical protein
MKKEPMEVQLARLSRSLDTILDVAMGASRDYPDLYLPLEDHMSTKRLELSLEGLDEADLIAVRNGLEAMVDAQPVFSWMLEHMPRPVLGADRPPRRGDAVPLPPYPGTGTAPAV